MTEELSRSSALASRHFEPGFSLEDWNGTATVEATPFFDPIKSPTHA